MGLVSSQPRGELQFSLNGQRVVIPAAEVDPNMTLNEYIRTKTVFKGTKLSCGEGGCGACAVMISRNEARPGGQLAQVNISVNSCLRPLASLDGWAVTTSEGIGGTKHEHGFHPIQERIANMNGTQCGFCTPGMVMTMYSALKSHNHDMKCKDIEDTFDGNICRCTGYRPIMDACKSFAKDHDIEDLVCKVYKKEDLGPYDAKRDPAPLMVQHERKPLVFQSRHPDGDTVWIRPTSLGEVLDVLREAPADQVKLVVAHTSAGIYKTDRKKVMVDIQDIPELRAWDVNENGLSVGAGLSITRFIECLDYVEARALNKDQVVSFKPLRRHAWRIANVHVRNVGSIGGNLVMAKTKGFLSDLATILLAAQATVTLVSRTIVLRRRTISLEEFLADPVMRPGEILESIRIPYTKKGDYFKTYKAALRFENAHAYINAGFRFNVDQKTQIITEAVCAFGGVQAEDEAGSHAIYAKNVQLFLVGKPANGATLSAAIRLLNQEVQPAAKATRRAYRQRLVSSFFFKFFTDVVCSLDPANPVDDVVKSATLNEGYMLNARPVSSGAQGFKFPDTHAPVSDAVPKVGAKLQASGETQYVDDIPIAQHTLFGAFVASSRARAKIVLVDPAAALALPGVKAFFSAKDIPGKNDFSPMPPCGVLPVFAAERVEYAGQPIGLIVATSTRLAEQAAKYVKVQYDDEGKKPIVTLDQAMDEKECDAGMVQEAKVGDADANLGKDKHRIQGTIRMGSQQHFYMEPQVAYALPNEGKGIRVYCPNQWPDALMAGVAAVLKIDHAQVELIMRRAGGGFGGKLTHAMIVATASSLAAYKLNVPVRVVLNRNVDMRIVGGREEVLANYDVAFNDEGRISALVMKGLLNAGFANDLSWFTTSSFANALNQNYDIPHYHSHVKLLKTNLPSRTAVRAPGEIQASWVMEQIIEHVAHECKLPSYVVQQRNFYPGGHDDLKVPNGHALSYYTIPELWKQAMLKSKFEQRHAEVKAFNEKNRWRKRGLGVCTVRYEVGVWQKNALVNVYGDGSVIVTVGGTEIGQGLHTKVSQVVAYQLGTIVDKPLDMDKIRFGELNTNVLPNAPFTGGSTGSEASMEAARRACQTLCNRLAPVKEMILKGREAKQDENKVVTWEELVMTAKFAAGVNLSAQDHWAGGGPDHLGYQNYGVAVSEVELDVLTGETIVLSTDMIYDCGKSLNPAVDIGQCEGAYIMGLGFIFREQVVVDDNGVLTTEGTWAYKPPGVKDIPVKLNIELLQDKFDKGLLSSKCSGEPPLVLATSAGLALREAIESARSDAGIHDYFNMECPITVDQIQQLCGFDPAKHFQLSAKDPVVTDDEMLKISSELEAKMKGDADGHGHSHGNGAHTHSHGGHGHSHGPAKAAAPKQASDPQPDAKAQANGAH